MTRRTALPLSAIAITLLGAPALAQVTPNTRTPSGTIMRTFDTPYYILHTDLGEADAREADLRMTRMFEEYQRRTSGFAGQVKGKFPFFLFQNQSDYYAAGGPKGSAGVYIEGPSGNRLMAVAGPKTDAGTWHVVQHEGFHQFIAATIKGEIPIWANEGLAEYFGEARWTGDGFVTGLIPPARLKEVKAEITRNHFKPFSKILAMTDQEWGDSLDNSDRLDYSNYTEAWAMIHFLAHGDGGKYQSAFLQFMTQVGKGQPAQAVWTKVFGSNTAAFETRFAQWWMSLPEEPTRSGYFQALVATETSFFARAYLQRQTFPDPNAFFHNYKPPTLAINRDLWLPPSLFEDSSDEAQRVGQWSTEMAPNQPPHLICVDEGIKYTGSFILNNGKVARVTVDITNPTGRRCAD